MNTQKPLISVIIPHLNQLDELEFCLESLNGQTLDPVSFEVIVVDNGSKTLPSPAPQRFPLRVLQELEPGPGPARNRGAEVAAGAILAFIDADCRADSDWLKQALQLIQESSAKTILGGDVQIWRENPPSFTALEAYESVFAYRFQLYIEKQGFCGTGNLVVRREDFQEIGPFKGIQHAEDVEWGRSVRLAGFKFRFVPEMIVFHPARKSIKELMKKWDRHIGHALNASRGQPFWLPIWLARATAILISPAIDWLKVARSDRISGFGPRIKANGVMTLIRVYRFGKMISVLFGDNRISWNAGTSVRNAGA
ncbi:MAG: glycosyltransferase family 2 protein [Rhodomicrobium sp.]